MLENLALGFAVSLSFHNVLYCLIGCVLGTAIGVLPGLGPVATIAMLLTFTYQLDVTSAVIMLSGIYYGAQYGGTITSVLLNIPGEAASVVTTLDGYEMAKRGEAGKALGIAAFGSFIGGTAGVVALAAFAPIVASWALKFGPAEYTSLMVFGLILIVFLTSRSRLKALLMGAVGLALGVVGLDPVTSYERLTFGSFWLLEGFEVGIVAMGLFGVGEILYMAHRSTTGEAPTLIKSPRRTAELLPDAEDWKRSAGPIGRGTVLGFLLGTLPGGGAVIASYASYALESRLGLARRPLGTGAIEGVAGPETANNSASSGAFVPLLTLGIPSNVPMALLIGAFMIHGITPGPFVITEHPQVFWGIITSMFIGNIILVLLNVPLIRFFVKIIEVPYPVLSAIVIFVCAIGAYSINNNTNDVLAMFAFGLAGYLMRLFDYEPAPLILAFIIGPLLEQSLRQTLILGHGSLAPFFTSPISLGLLVATLVFAMAPLLLGLAGYGKAARKLAQLRNSASETD